MRRALTAGAASLALLAGCGGGGQEGGTDRAGAGASRLTREAFVAQASRTCRQSALETQAAARRLAADPEIRRLEPAEQRVELFRRLLPVTRRGVERLARLRPPAELEPDLRRFVGQLDQVYEVVPALIAAGRRGDRPRTTQLTTRIAELAGSSRRLATRLGLSACLPENAP